MTQFDFIYKARLLCDISVLSLPPDMKRYTLLIIMLLAGVLVCGAEEQKKFIKGFSGGMMAHTGYMFGGDNPYGYNPKGVTFGLGGCAKLHFTKHFRAGFEGYFSNVGLKKGVFQSGSHNKLFWTGALADWFWTCGKLTPYVGTTVGGGMETALYMTDGDKHDWVPETAIIYHKQPFLAIDPYIGTEYAIGKALRFTFKADWLLAINSDGLNRPLGPRVYFGIIFTH